MTEETKELINCIRVNLRHNKLFKSMELDKEDLELLLDCITNLQQKVIENQNEIMKLENKLEQQRKEQQETYKDIRIEIKEKNEQIKNLQQEKSDICKNRLAIAIESARLQQENERLNKRHFILQGGRYNCKTYITNLEKQVINYESKFKKTIRRISLLKMDDVTVETNKALDYVLNSLIGSADNE